MMGSTRRGRRRTSRLHRSALFVCLAPVTTFVLLYVGVCLGYEMPRSTIGSGVKNFEGEERKIAHHFRGYTAGLVMGHTSEAYLQTGARVVEIDRCPSAPPFRSQSLKYAVGGTRFSGTIRLHTFFGVPYGRVVNDCRDEYSVYRFFTKSRGL